MKKLFKISLIGTLLISIAVVLPSCKEKPTLPVVTTGSVSAITQTTAISGGNVTDDGGSVIIARGVHYHPEIYLPNSTDGETKDGTGMGIFTSNITGLESNTVYHIYAYATNCVGTTLGEEISFTTLKETVSDIDGNIYPVVTIKNHHWMAENLKTTRYRNGDIIGTTTPATLDITTEINPKYQWAYDGNENNVVVYGRLYTWYAINDSRNVCPIGWHVSSDAEWTDLVSGWPANLAAAYLREPGTTHWKNDIGASNSTGFTALPGGLRSLNQFENITDWGDWWCSTEFTSDVTQAIQRVMVSGDVYSTYVLSGVWPKSVGLSIRCVKD